ncbi:hypothetical protein OSTOST_15315 [Ostertagia ostertagi]
MLYGALFCPITWIIIRDIGQLALVYLTTVYARLKLRFNHVIWHLMGALVRCAVRPTWVRIGLVPFIIFHFPNIHDNWLGDVMPNNIPFDPIICSVVFFSLSMLKVINRMSYLSMENGVHGVFAVASTDSWTIEADDMAAEEADITNQLTIHSIATFMQSNADVYGGRLGRVNLRKSDIASE